MKLNDRQERILALLSAQGELGVDTLADEFTVSAQTIRKDLNQLCEMGRARRVHGGVSLPANALNLSFNRRQQLHADSKQRMAEALAARIPDGATLMLGIGTTVAYLARCLSGHKRLRVLTNNLNVAGILGEQPDTHVLVMGGTLRHHDHDVVGETVTRSLDQYQVDIGIIGAGGLDPDAGVLDFDPLEADVSRAILRNARRRVLLADASKWNRRPMARVTGFDSIDQLVCDRLPDNAIYSALHDQGVDIIHTEPNL
ncbi:DeoR/GlpR family DNA-binding transcription regulator [Vreelandella massiliensis]|uniref:DeoR/GlpR family DNA-binding transcription regulator n=1 Tax=Vreelandella massiliensis TaxID=1816686 RepID=UPI00096AB388|nr:DeoR/GlpR family DNA-binding transcription regulator [Halomonas massiliensis]